MVYLFNCLLGSGSFLNFGIQQRRSVAMNLLKFKHSWIPQYDINKKVPKSTESIKSRD